MPQSGLHILFVCGKARKRSPTAAQLASTFAGIKADFAGLSTDADERLGLEQIAWADVIAVMERPQLARLKRQFGPALRSKKVICLDVADRFEFMAPDLVDLLTERFARLMPGQGPV